MRHLRAVWIGALALLVQLASGVAPAAAHEASSLEPVLPADQPARGLVYDGLVPTGPNSRCAGEFRVAVDGRLACTHGPDPAPPGMDVRVNRSVAELRADTLGPAAASATPEEVDELIPCIGDGSAGKRVQVIYARAEDRPDHFDSVRSLIPIWAADASAVFDASAAQTGGSRKIRFVTTPGPDCELDVDSVTLSAEGDDQFDNTAEELLEAGYDSPNRKYMVLVDARVICGMGEVRDDERPGPGNVSDGAPGAALFARVDETCWGRLGEWISAEAHELVHNLGGIQQEAPHSTKGFHCFDEYDTMCYDDGPFSPPLRFVCPPAEEKLLDCGDDDYFNTDPPPGSYLATHWNLADSAFLTAAGPSPPPPPPEPPQPPEPPVPPEPASAPSTSILAGPRGAARARTATFRFAADMTATFVCRLDQGRRKPCSSPQRYRGLPKGRHVFRVAARNDEGRADPSPAVRRFEILPRRTR